MSAGRVAQEVNPNQKCEGCLHYDRQVGRTGACLIGDSPWKCGDGDAPDIGYAPLARGAGGQLPDMSCHGAHASEVGPQVVGGLYGSGSTRPVEIRQVSLGEEHVHLVKSLLAQHADLQKSQCLRCSMGGAHGTAPHNTDPQPCTCRPIEAATVAKAVVGRMSNAQRAAMPIEVVTGWVREVAKAGFRLPVSKTARGAADTLADALAEMGVRVGGRSDGRLGGHLQPVEKGSFSKLGHAAMRLTNVAHSTNGRASHQNALDAHKKVAAEGGPKASFHEQHVAYHAGQLASMKKSFYSDEWINQFKGTPLFDEARKLCERELEMEEDELKRREESAKHDKARAKALKQVSTPAPDFDWQEQDARRTKIRIAKQRLALKLAGLHQEKLKAR